MKPSGACGRARSKCSVLQFGTVCHPGADPLTNRRQDCAGDEKERLRCLLERDRSGRIPMRDDLKARLLTEGLAAHLEHRRELLRGCTFEEQVDYIAGPANTRELPYGWSCVTVMAYPSHLFESRWDEDRDRISCVMH